MSSSTIVSYGIWVCGTIKSVPITITRFGLSWDLILTKGAQSPEEELEDPGLIAIPCWVTGRVEHFRVARCNLERASLLGCFYLIEEES